MEFGSKNIIKGRVEIYHDFMRYLLFNINKYYLDSDTLSDEVDRENHFIFCYNKACEPFLEEGIDFRDNEELIDYYYQYLVFQIYLLKDDVEYNEELYEKYCAFWDKVFTKTSHVGALAEIYYTSNISIEKSKKTSTIF